MTTRTNRSEGPTMITSNSKQPYAFIVTLEAMNSKIKIQAKNTQTKDAYLGEYTQQSIKKIGYFQSVKGFYNRLRMAIESRAPNELIAYYVIQSTYSNKNSRTKIHQSPSGSSSALVKEQQLVLTLEERSKYDDESQKYNIRLAQLNIADTVKLNEKLGDVAIAVDKKYLKTQKTLEIVIQQVKQKFSAEKEAREAIEDRVQYLESLCKKLMKKCLKLQEQIADVSANQSSPKKNADFGFGPDNPESKDENGNSTTAAGANTVTLNMSEKIDACEKHILESEQKLNNDISIINKKLDDVRPKLVRLKTRKDFASEQGFVDYITKKLEQWDSNKFGPILVRVKNNATGKAKHFIGYVGEPQKWNHTICKVQWFGLGKKLPESVEWKALDVFLPLSAFYYPDCPHARSSFQQTKKAPERL
jgi:uncharacterized protein YxjI